MVPCVLEDRRAMQRLVTVPGACRWKIGEETDGLVSSKVHHDAGIPVIMILKPAQHQADPVVLPWSVSSLVLT